MRVSWIKTVFSKCIWCQKQSDAIGPRLDASAIVHSREVWKPQCHGVSELSLWWFGMLADVEHALHIPETQFPGLCHFPVHLVPGKMVIQGAGLGRNQLLELLLMCIIFNNNNDEVSRGFESVQVSTARLWSILHTAATLVLIEHVRLLFQTLQWLTISLGVEAKVLKLAHRALHDSLPPALFAYLFLRTIKNILPQGLCTSCSLCLGCCHWLPPSSTSSLHSAPSPFTPLFFSWALSNRLYLYLTICLPSLTECTLHEGTDFFNGKILVYCRH